MSDREATCKPPLGVMPREIHQKQRAKELARALHERLEANLFDKSVKDWAEELDQITKDWSCFYA